MAMQRFDDRWTFANPALAGVPLSNLTDQILSSLSPDFMDYAAQVRNHSILITRKNLVDIYRIATMESDPRIALLLGAANVEGVRPFGSLEAVKAAMFGPVDDNDLSFVDNVRNIFAQGVKRVSIALTAARLIAQLSQVEQQAKHAVHLERQALADLKELIGYAASGLTPEQQVVQDVKAALLFEMLEMNLVTPLTVRVFMPTEPYIGWTTVASYSGVFSTAMLVADLSDTINSLTLQTNSSNLIAAPILSDGNNLHRLELASRVRSADVAMEVISVEVAYNDPSITIPFRWGVKEDALFKRPLNSVLVQVQQGKASTLASAAEQAKAEPIVFYFKRANVNQLNQPVDYDTSVIDNSDWINADFVFRVSPTMDTPKTVTMPRLTSSDPDEQLKLDQNRPAQLATLLLNELAEIKGPTKALGSLFRNDDPLTVTSWSALELIAWTVTNPEAFIILDILSLPKDILLATGNLQGPMTSFTNKPRSVRVEARFFSGQAATGTNMTFKPRAPEIIKPPESPIVRMIRDRKEFFGQQRWL